MYNAHAFFDGNKRMTRLIIANQLFANGFPLMIPHGNQYLDYNVGLIEGMIAQESVAIERVIETGFNQYLSEEIEKYKSSSNSSSDKGFRLIL